MCLVFHHVTGTFTSYQTLVYIFRLSSETGQSSLPPLTLDAVENSTTKNEGVHQMVPENPVHKISSSK